MKTFTNYIEQKNLDIAIHKVATKMVELDVDPYEYLLEHYKNQPEVVIQLEAHREENLTEFMQGLRNMAGAAWNAFKGAGQNLGTAGQALGQGLAATGRQFRDEAFGPEAKYKVALKAVQALTAELENNSEIQRLQSSGQAGINAGDLIEELNRIANDLQRQSDQVVQVLRRGKEQQTVTQTPATRGNVPTQQQQVQSPPVQQPVEYNPNTKQFA